MTITEVNNTFGIFEAIIEKLPKHLKDDSTAKGIYGSRFNVNTWCVVLISSRGSDQFKVQLELMGNPIRGNRKTTYIVTDLLLNGNPNTKGGISPNFWKRIESHTIRSQKAQDKQERDTIQRKRDIHQLIEWIPCLNKLNLKEDSYDMGHVKDGYFGKLRFESTDSTFEISLEIDCNGEVILGSLNIISRAIDLDTIKKLISIFGLTRFNPVKVERQLDRRKDGELFDLSNFIF